MKKRFLALLLVFMLIPGLRVDAFATSGGPDAAKPSESPAAAASPAVEASPAAETPKPEDFGIIDGDMLKQKIDAYCTEKGITGKNMLFSVGFCYTATGDEWYYNGDSFMYSASMYKVPNCMMLSELEREGTLTQESEVLGYKVDYLEKAALVNSNNDAGHAIADYIGKDKSKYDTYAGKNADLAKKYAPDLSDNYYKDDFYKISYYSARFITKVIKTLYEGGDTAFPHIIGLMKQAQPENYFHLTVKDYEIAQKYGAFTERNKNQNNHNTGIIYTPNPVIVTVMTRNVANSERAISDIAAMLTEYALTLDTKLDDYRKAQEAAALAAAQATPVPVPSEPAYSVETMAPDFTPAPKNDNSGSSKSSIPVWLIAAIVGAVVVAAVLVTLFAKKRNAQDFDGYDDEDDPDIYEDYGKRALYREADEYGDENIRSSGSRPSHAAEPGKSSKKKSSRAGYIPKH